MNTVVAGDGVGGFGGREVTERGMTTVLRVTLVTRAISLRQLSGNDRKMKCVRRGGLIFVINVLQGYIFVETTRNAVLRLHHNPYHGVTVNGLDIL